MMGPQGHALYLKVDNLSNQLIPLNPPHSECHFIPRQPIESGCNVSKSPLHWPTATGWAVSFGFFYLEVLAVISFNPDWIRLYSRLLVVIVVQLFTASMLVPWGSYSRENFIKLLYTLFLLELTPTSGELDKILYELLEIFQTFTLNPKLEPIQTLYLVSSLECVGNEHSVIR